MSSPCPRQNYTRAADVLACTKYVLGSFQGGNTTYTCPEWHDDTLMLSSNHHRTKSGAWDGGGPFYVIKETMIQKGLTYRYLYNGISYTCYMPGMGQIASPTVISAKPTFASQQSRLAGLYATGNKRARPGNPVASLGQFIIELRDLPRIPFTGSSKGKLAKRLTSPTAGVPIGRLPVLLKERLFNFRSLGSEYLNVVFGWKPFVSDLRKMYYLWQDIDKRMAQIVRENGKYIRRRASIDSSNSSTQTYTHYGFPFANVPGGPPWHFSGTTEYTVTETTTSNSWFSGSYRYYIPDVGSSAWDKRARLALFGALPTPELLWEVLPWSWLIDWFANVGDVMSNISTNAVDNLTMRYSFVMEHTTYTKEVKSLVNVPGAGQNIPSFAGNITSTYTKEVKLRNGGGNPYGLNVQLATLNGHQLAILAALGLSRGLVQ